MDNNQIVIYQTEDGLTKIEVNFDNETVWLTQAQISELFQRERSVITKHINNVFSERELDEESNVQILHIANSDKPVKLYNLDVIISVGYRVKSKRGVQFRQWALKVIALTDLILQAQQSHEEIILEVTDFRPGTEYGYNTPCPPELQKP